MTIAQSSAGNGFRRVLIFAGLAFLLSSVAWLGLVWLSEYGLPFNRRFGYAFIVILCGVLAAALKMWRRDHNVAFNLITSLTCFVMPALALAFVVASALYIACHGQVSCD